MNEAVIPVRISDPLLTAAHEEAQRAGVSIERWLLSVAEERIRDAQVSERFFERMDQESAAKTLLDVLDSVKDGPPVSGDEPPAAYRPTSIR